MEQKRIRTHGFTNLDLVIGNSVAWATVAVAWVADLHLASNIMLALSGCAASGVTIFAAAKKRKLTEIEIEIKKESLRQLRLDNLHREEDLAAKRCKNPELGR